jgi:hypothetical protein
VKDLLDPYILAREIEDALLTSGYNADVVEERIGVLVQVRVAVRHPTDPTRVATVTVKAAPR